MMYPNPTTRSASATTANKSFKLQWIFECSGGSGADGFCVQWTTTNNSNGNSGGDVSRIESPSTIHAFTFQSYLNNLITWWANNVSVDTFGVTSGYFRQNVYYWMDYNHTLSTMTLYMSTSNTKPISPSKIFTSFVFDGGSYYFGFGAACGGSNDNHILKSMKLRFI